MSNQEKWVCRPIIWLSENKSHAQGLQGVWGILRVWDEPHVPSQTPGHPLKSTYRRGCYSNKEFKVVQKVVTHTMAEKERKNKVQE
jgi:hypothetical protein